MKREDMNRDSFLVVVALVLPDGETALVALDPATHADPSTGMAEAAVLAIAAITDAECAVLEGWRVPA